MARQEENREDLLAEATALVERAEIAVVGPAGEDDEPHVVLGFRRDGGASLYFGDEPAYHFTSQGALRRAYLEGRLLKSVAGQLVLMTRERAAHAVQLRSRTLSVEEAAETLADLARRLSWLAEALDGGRYRLVGQVPPDVDVVGRGRRLLALLAAGITIAPAPHAR